MLKNKVALITGGGQGVGQGIALALAKEGAHIVVTGRTLEKCETTAKMLRDHGVKALALRCDVKSGSDLEEIMDKTIAEFGRLDILVNNAQEVARGPLLSITDEQMNGNWDSGPLATFRLMKLAYPHLKESKGNVINLCSSVMKRWDVGTYGVYAAVKAAIQQLTRAAANEWGKDGICVNAIMPHAKSPALAGWMERNPVEAEHFQKSIPLGYVGDCEDDIGAFVAMMCSENARYLSGQTIALDGGQVFIG
ncbi:SDR family NAD(P)-dependent oxidoreductase [Hellea balneolensis]|uniref:SDR family NAD(P)-dependent oxidoreductase n=1 Tax=Hellea balneolensis TaxID=287478 RepID=UPI00040A026E|nr:SDR family oxidoreductase [Hellea balneolensis]